MKKPPVQFWESRSANELRRITIISGGQTGADRAALDFAIEHHIPHSGWCPRGRVAEDGKIPLHYNLQSTSSRKYSQRTEWNVRDSDATVLFTIAPRLLGGTALTASMARVSNKPLLHLSRDTLAGLTHGDLSAATAEAAKLLLQFVKDHHVRRLNIAGPRASQEPTIARFVTDVLSGALRC
jgi:hypothetical protein